MKRAEQIRTSPLFRGHIADSIIIPKEPDFHRQDRKWKRIWLYDKDIIVIFSEPLIRVYTC
jgi:hypothetical protein